MSHFHAPDMQGPGGRSTGLPKDTHPARRLHDPDEAIVTMKWALDAALDDRSRAEHLYMLSCQASDRYDKAGVMAELDASIRAVRRAIDITPDNKDRAGYLNGLGN